MADVSTPNVAATPVTKLACAVTVQAARVRPPREMEEETTTSRTTTDTSDAERPGASVAAKEAARADWADGDKLVRPAREMDEVTVTAGGGGCGG